MRKVSYRVVEWSFTTGQTNLLLLTYKISQRS
jgi:hypothetical protein